MKLAVVATLLIAAHAKWMLKVGIAPASFSQMMEANLASSVAACNDLTAVTDLTTLPNAFPTLKQKCGTYEFEHGKVWKSPTVKKGLGVDLLTYTVPGLNGKTVGDVFKALGDAGCSIYPWGGVVRDQFLGKPPRDVDAEVSCGLPLAYYVCKTNFGASNCEWEAGDYVLNVRPNTHVSGTFGVEGLDYAEWDGVFFKPQRLEYTTNAIGYDSNGNNVILDVTDNGVMDTCHKIIRIPGPATFKNWDAWSDSEKQYRYFKLIYKGYKPVSETLRRYNTFRTEESIRADPKHWAKWYCKTVLSGKYDKTTSHCKLSADSRAACKDLKAKKKAYDKAFRGDLSGRFWRQLASPPLKNFMADCYKYRAADLVDDALENVLDELF